MRYCHYIVKKHQLFLCEVNYLLYFCLDIFNIKKTVL